ncbi:MAG TPA: hypothetical protein VFC18_04735 [Burkholderiales bacterium]|nr:hypothetical protein [Burkholderiales bacterium]
MSDLAAFLETHFALLFAICLGWIVLVVVASVIYRTSRGKPVLTRAPNEPLFLERWTSGRSLRSALTRLGGARNCLLVAITRNALVIRPHFPFTLLFLPEVYGLDWTIPRSSIQRVDQVEGLMGRRLLVEFLTGEGNTERVELILRESEQFRQALAR